MHLEIVRALGAMYMYDRVRIERRACWSCSGMNLSTLKAAVSSIISCDLHENDVIKC